MDKTKVKIFTPLNFEAVNDFVERVKVTDPQTLQSLSKDCWDHSTADSIPARQHKRDLWRSFYTTLIDLRIIGLLHQKEETGGECGG